jgi:5-methyltetrahydrofolate--homocysteine methyltransferase
MKGLLERLAAGEGLISDGAMGTLLLERGLKPGSCPEQINLERPEVPSEIARLYAEAGADIVSTNTFGATPLKLALFRCQEHTEAINRAAVRAARRAVPTGTLVAASCGPTGRLLEPYGDTAPEEVFQSFLRQMQALMAEGVDLVVIETMTDLAEAQLALRAARQVSAAVPVAVTFTFECTPSGFRTIMGASIEEAIETLAGKADILGSNCGLGSHSMVEVAREFRRHTDQPLLIQPNAGLPSLKGEVVVYPESPEVMAACAHELMACRVNIVGGCCGTTPAHTRAMREAVRLARLPATK